MIFLTFVTSKPTPDFDLWIKKSYPDIVLEDREILDDRAVRWHLDRPVDKEVLDRIRREFRCDIFQTDTMPIRLLMADMDSTIVSGETLDDMADMIGIGKKISSITDRAMRGELDFEQALSERINLLAGMSEDIIEQAVTEMQLNTGAQEFLSHCKSKGVYCVLISGGFTQFTAHVAQYCGFDAHFGNRLVIENGVLTGDVERPILDKNFKLEKMQALQDQKGISVAETMAIGDGANDLPMLSHAGIGVSYFGKPLLQDALVNQIAYTDLSSLIYIV